MRSTAITRPQLDALLARFLTAAQENMADWLPGSAAYRAGILLLAADLASTTDTAQLCAVTGLDAAFVTACSTRLHATGVWQAGQSVSAVWWQEYGALALMLDIMVALGRARRVIDSDGTIRWTTALTSAA